MKFINFKKLLKEIGHFNFLTISVLLFLTLTAFFAGQNSLPPIDRDEARFAQASRQMLQNSDYINIKFQDEIRAKKPVGIYWIQALSANFLGEISISSYRFPSIISSIISILFVGLLARLIFPIYQSLIIILFFASSITFIGETHLAKTDATLLALICVQQYYLLNLILKKGSLLQNKYLYPSIIWLVFAFGILVKGPLSIAILFLTIIAFCLLKKDFSLIKSLNPLLGIIICLIVILPWVLAINDSTQGLFLEKAFNDDFVNKLKSGQEGHGAWPGAHFLMLPITLWPIAIFIPGSVLFVLNNKTNIVVQFLVCWIVPFWILIEIVPTKLFHYSLPVLPAIAILSIGSLFHFKSNINNINNNFFRKIIIYVSIFFGLGGVILGGAILYFSSKFNFNYDLSITIGAITVFIITIIIFFLSIILIKKSEIYIKQNNKFIYNIPFLIIFLATIFNIINFQFILPKLDYLYPSRLILNKIKDIKPDAIAISGYHEPSLVFLLNGEVLLSSPQEVAIFMAEGKNNIGLVEDDALKEFLDISKELNSSIRTDEVIKGYNIAKGKHVKIHIFKNQMFDLR
jgi:4-amino-4-deoxy-L-arabinose transferase-like glycosyltransferase